MSAVRKEHRLSNNDLQQGQEGNTLDYTAQWVSGVEPPEKAHSVEPVKHADPSKLIHPLTRGARSAPALSTRSHISNRSVTRRSRLELELKHLKEEQELFKEKREFELEMKRQELERERMLAEWEERRRLQQLEARLAEARLEEEIEDNNYVDSGSELGEEVPDTINEAQIEPGAPINADGATNHNEYQRPTEDDAGHEGNEDNNQSSPRLLAQTTTRPQQNVGGQVTDFGQSISQQREIQEGLNDSREINSVYETQADPRLQQAVQRGNVFQPFTTRVVQAEPRMAQNPDHIELEPQQATGERHQQVCSQDPNVIQPARMDTSPIAVEQPDRMGQNVYPRTQAKPEASAQQFFEQQQDMLRMMASTIGSSISKGFEMPKREYLTFDGNPLTYPSFIQNFKTNVEDIESNPNARRNLLIQLCTGKAKDAISGTVMLPPEEGYGKAQSILREMFGQTHIIAASHIDRVTKGGAIREFESEKLLQLARDMENCQMNLSKLGFYADINSRGNMTSMVLRLPRHLRSEWAKEAQNSRENGVEPDFAQLTKFVVKKAKLANTEYGRLVNTKPEVEREKFKKPRVGSTSSKATSFAISGSVRGEDSPSSDRPSSTGRPKCYYCEKDGHTIERCFKFQEKSYDDRKGFVFKKGLCNLCLSKGHYASRFKKAHGCFIPGCGKRHHPILHPVVSAPEKSEAKQDREAQDSTTERHT